MRVIPLADHGQFKAREVLRTIVQTPPPGAPLNIDEVRKRCRVIDALDRSTAGNNSLLLEDADWQILSRAVDTFGFGIAHPDLLKIVEAIKEARETAIHPVPNEASA